MPSHRFDGPEDLQRAIMAAATDDGFRVPDIIGTVEGWRAWHVSLTPPPYGLPPKMFSVSYRNDFWLPRQRHEATCQRNCKGSRDPSIGVPNENCTCGFYSAKTLDHLLSLNRRYWDYQIEDGEVAVIGQLANWGKVVDCSQGYRSQYAYPVKLFIPFEAWTLAKPLSEAYGVPVQLHNHLKFADQIEED